MLFYSLESFFAFYCPFELLVGFEHVEEWQTTICCLRNKPVKSYDSLDLYTCFDLVGLLISSNACIFSGFTFIPCWLTMKPRNFPKTTSKAHLRRFNFVLPEDIEHIREVNDTICGLLRFDQHVIQIYLHSFLNLINKHSVD